MKDNCRLESLREILSTKAPTLVLRMASKPASGMLAYWLAAITSSSTQALHLVLTTHTCYLCNART